MINSPAKMAALVESQVKTIADPIVRSALQSILISPIKQKRESFYGGDSKMLSCWLVMKYNDDGIVYCNFGFEPSKPWALVFLSNSFIGAADWFHTLEKAFYRSPVSFDLKIWNLVKKVKGEILEVTEDGLTLYEAYEKRDKLKLDPAIYSVEHRIYPSN